MDDRILSYDELRLWLEGGDGSYRVRAEGPDGRRASGTFSPPFDEVHLDNFVLRVGRRTRTVRAYRSSQMEQAKGFGQQLFDSIITGDVRDLYLTACGISESRGRGLRITLFLTEAPDLMGIPWEFMYERPSFLAQSIYTPIVRSFDFKNPRAPRRLSPPLRVLGMASSPLGFDTLDAGQERSKLENALHGLMAAGLVEFSWLERPTLGELERVLSASDELHVLHYIGHGAYDERVAGGYLVLENDRGDPHEVSGEELGSLLYDKRSMRLAVLNACEGARSSHVDPFSGVASSLVEHGIPAVIGMQFEITDSAAVTFTGRLYDALTDGFPVDAALAQARKAIWAASRPQATISSSALRCCSCAPPTPASSTSSAPARRTPWPWASPSGGARTWRGPRPPGVPPTGVGVRRRRTNSACCCTTGATTRARRPLTAEPRNAVTATVPPAWVSCSSCGGTWKGPRPPSAGPSVAAVPRERRASGLCSGSRGTWTERRPPTAGPTRAAAGSERLTWERCCSWSEAT